MSDSTAKKPVKIRRALEVLAVGLFCFLIFVAADSLFSDRAATPEELSAAASGNSCVKEEIESRIDYELHMSASTSPISKGTLKRFISKCENESVAFGQADAIK